MKLPPETEQYFIDLSLLFVQPGWRRLKEDFEGFKQALIEGALDVRTVDDFWFAKGRLDAFRQLLAYEDFITGSKKELDEAPEPVPEE